MNRLPSSLHLDRRRLHLAAAALGLLVLALACAPAARAADLLVLDSEQATISGNQSYGFVYVDGELRLTGDTTISAASIYFGPNAGLRTCFVEGSGSGGCTAGRSLTLRSAGPLSLASGIDLQAGSGSVRNGGTLNVQGAQVAIGGDVNTAGSGGGTSGAVTISSSGPLSVGSIYAYGAPVSLTAGGAIDVGGDIQAQGASQIAAADAGRMQRGAPVTVASSGGDVRIGGNVITYGRDAPGNGGAGLGGGSGSDISISGGDVRVGTVDGTGGSSTDATAGPSGQITLAARGALHALGRLEAGGQNSSAAQATAGARISAAAGGPLVVAGGAWTGGGQGSTGGMPGGQIVLKGSTVTTGTLFAAGASGANSGTPGDGGNGGAITVTADGATSISSLQAYGGNGPGGTAPGRGGPISVTSAGGSIATGRVTTQGGYPNSGPGSDGGPVTLSAQGDLTVSDSLNSSASSANGDADPARRGGNAGSVLLRAATGNLTLGDTVRAEGGGGAGHPVDGAFGGAGGAGGRIDIVTRGLGPIVALTTHGGYGGDYGDDRGPGGAGGAVTAWTDAPLFDDQKVVDTDGGDGNPVGASGMKTAEQSPTTPAIDAGTNALSFTSRSPDATGYRVLRSAGGGAPQTALETTASTGIKVPAPACVPVAVTIVATNAQVGWVSDPSPAVTYTRPASSTQQCSEAPAVRAARKLRFKRRALRRARWRAAILVRSDGIGAVRGTLTRVPRRGSKTSRRTLAKLSATLSKPGTQTLKLVLPRAAQRTGTYALKLVTTAPDGKGRRTTTLKLEVRG